MSARDTDLPGEISPSDGPQSVQGVGPTYGTRLKEAGYTTVSDLQEASVGELSDVVPIDTARQIKEQVGNVANRGVSDIAEAKQKAQRKPGAVAKTVRVDGSKVAKVLEKVGDEQMSGGTLEIHKG